MFRFAHPEYLFLLILIPVLVGVFIYSTLQKRKKIKQKLTRVWQNGGRSAKFEHSYFYQHLWLIEHLYFNCPAFAKPQTVNDH